jgi:hypothetical protein
MLHWGLTAGFRYQEYTLYQAIGNYFLRVDKGIFAVLIEVSGSSMAFNLDYTYIKFGSLHLSAGLDFDISSVNIVGTRQFAPIDGKHSPADAAAVDEALKADVQIYSAASSATVMSLRLPARYIITLGSFGLFVSIVPMIPLTVLTSSFTPDGIIADPANEDFGEKDTTTQQLIFPGSPSDNLQGAIDHKQGAFALETAFGLSFLF